MRFVLAKYLKDGEPHGRGYTFRTEDKLRIGDRAVTADGKALEVCAGVVDMDWVRQYGEDKLAVVSKADVGKESEVTQ